MKPLFSALLEAIVLAVSVIIVMLCAKLFNFESNLADHAGSPITVGEAMGYTSEGTDTPEAAAEEAAQKIFGANTEKTLPAAVGKLLCTEVGEKTAKVLELYPFIVFIESILCLIFGITLPCSLYRHIDPAKSIDDAIVNKNLVYEDGYGRSYGYVGETRAGIFKDNSFSADAYHNKHSLQFPACNYYNKFCSRYNHGNTQTCRHQGIGLRIKIKNKAGGRRHGQG